MPEIPDLTELFATLGLIGQVLFWVIGAYFVGHASGEGRSGLDLGNTVHL